MIAARGRAGVGRVLALAVLALAGCSTVETRIAEHAELYQSLAPATRSKLVAGVVEPGYTMTMVYIAYGAPQEVHRSRSPGPGSGEQVTWVYQQAYPVYDDFYEPFGFFYYHGYHHHHPFFLHHLPYYPRYRYAWRDYLRVVFEGGRVVRIEQVQ